MIYAGTAPVAAVYAGTAPVVAIYAGNVKVWPPEPEVLAGSWPNTAVPSVFPSPVLSTITLPAAPAPATWAVTVAFAWPLSSSKGFAGRYIEAQSPSGSALTSATEPSPHGNAWASSMTFTVTTAPNVAYAVKIPADAYGWPAVGQWCSGSWTAQKV